MIHEEFFNFVFTANKLELLLQERPASIEWINQLGSIMEEKTYPKDHTILNIDQTSEYIYFLKSGAIRAYYLDKNNEQCSSYLWNDRSIVADMASYMQQRPSNLNIRLRVKSDLIAIHRPALNKVLSQYPEANQFLTAVLNQFFLFHLERDMDIQTLTAAERCLKLLHANKKLLLHFSNREIASFLAVSHTHLYSIMKSMDQ